MSASRQRSFQVSSFPQFRVNGGEVSRLSLVQGTYRRYRAIERGEVRVAGAIVPS